MYPSPSLQMHGFLQTLCMYLACTIHKCWISSTATLRSRSKEHILLIFFRPPPTVVCLLVQRGRIVIVCLISSGTILPAKRAKAFSIHKYFTLRICLLYCSLEMCPCGGVRKMPCLRCIKEYQAFLVYGLLCINGLFFVWNLHFFPWVLNKCVNGGKSATVDPLDLSAWKRAITERSGSSVRLWTWV